MSQHLARIAKIDRIEDVGADKIQVAYIYGFSVVVSKSAQVGDIGIFFEAGDTQLSKEYCHNNNLFRHSELNKDPLQKGYIQDNGRIKVEKMFKGLCKSEGLFMPLDSLGFAGNYSKLETGNSFDTFEGIKICGKFINEQLIRQANSTKPRKKNSTPLFREHVDTEQLMYYIDSLRIGDRITISPKWHGTSFRTSYTKVLGYEFSWLDRLKKLFRFPSGGKETVNWECVTGTRRVVLSNDDTNKEGFHGSEEYRFEVSNLLKPYLAKGQTVFGEIVGFVNGKSIMPSHSTEKLDKEYKKKYGESFVYSYGCRPTQYKFVIYRISYTTEDGSSIDFSPEQIKEWCDKRSLLSVDVIYDYKYDGNKDALVDIVKNLSERPEKLTEDYYDPSHVNEGVVIRVDNGNCTPQFYKYKSWAFKVMEGIAKETQVDVEDANSLI